jgi:hypothetical protein
VSVVARKLSCPHGRSRIGAATGFGAEGWALKATKGRKPTASSTRIIVPRWLQIVWLPCLLIKLLSYSIYELRAGIKLQAAGSAGLSVLQAANPLPRRPVVYATMLGEITAISPKFVRHVRLKTAKRCYHDSIPRTANVFINTGALGEG